MDFRCTEYCNPFEKTLEKKKTFLKEFHKCHPKAKNIYNFISDNNRSHKLDFIETVYNGKCVYCGNNLNITDIQLFEIDHYQPKELYKDKTHDIFNLVSSCKICNRAKSDFDFSNLSKFDIETGFPQLFIRDDLFNIKISNDYIEDEEVQNFYKQMRYSIERRRLDYLLLIINGLYNEFNDKEIKNELSNAIHILTKKRNKMALI